MLKPKNTLFDSAGDSSKPLHLRASGGNGLKVFSVVLIVFGVATSICCDLIYGQTDGMLGGLLISILGGQLLLYSKES